MLDLEEIANLVKGFRESFLNTEEGKNHLSYLQKREPQETKTILDKLRSLPQNGDEFTDLVLYGLLPNSETKYSKRVSLAPAFWNIRKFFARFHYTENDWKELAILVYNLADGFQKNPSDLEKLIRTFISHKLSKALQCGSLSPIFFALNQSYPIVNNREIRAYRGLSFLVFGQVDELSQRLEDYMSNVDKIKKLTSSLQINYNFTEISNLAVFDLFCYWYDEQRKGKQEVRKEKITAAKALMPAIEEKHMANFFRSLSCSEPQPFFVSMGETRNLEKLDAEGKIIYNTEFQRGEVWDKPRKQKLIDSILRGYNINTIFLRQLPDGRFECLDGQQRLKTIIREFMKDTFPINPKITPEFKRFTNFSELPEPLKAKIRNYTIFAIILYTDKDEETCKIFLRLQEGLPLNAAEKLNAMMGFLRNEIVEIAKKQPFMANLGIEDYRFAHRYILAQVYLLTQRNQITDVKGPNLQELYITYKEARPPEVVSNTVKKVLNLLDKEFGQDAKAIEMKADFISLYLLAKHLMENYSSDTSSFRLRDFFIPFVVKVGQVESSDNEENAPYYDYKTYRKASADSKTSIEKRFNVILSKYLESSPNLLPKDPNRNFDYWERLAVYWRDNGVCQLRIHPQCKGKIPFAEGTVDHKIPHSKSGPTTIENGQWSCVPCNLKKLAKILEPTS